MWSTNLLVLWHLATSVTEASNLPKDLADLLSSRAFITHDPSAAPRWSDYQAPQPTYIVHVGEELDVAKTVRTSLTR